MKVWTEYVIGVCNKVRTIRQEMGFTQKSLAKKAGVGLRAVRSLELGNFDMKVKYIIGIVKALGYKLVIRKDRASN